MLLIHAIVWLRPRLQYSMLLIELFHFGEILRHYFYLLFVLGLSARLPGQIERRVEPLLESGAKFET